MQKTLCDRCGNDCQGYVLKATVPFDEEFYATCCGSRIAKFNKISSMEVDLCQSCYNDLYLFMKNGKKTAT